MTVPPFRPYGGDDIRVVSDVSRFDYGETQKIRSRNTTPTNTDILVENNDNDNDNASSSKLTLDTIIPLYSTRINEGTKYNRLNQQEDRNTQTQTQSRTEPPIQLPKREKKVNKNKAKYSISIQVPQDHFGYVSEPVVPPPPIPPPKDIKPSNVSGVPYPNDQGNNNNNLPPMPQPTHQMYPQQQQQSPLPPIPSSLGSRHGGGGGDGGEESILTPQQKLEQELIKQVMNRPVVLIRGDRFGQQYSGKHYSISANFVLYVFEICCSIVEIVLTSLLLQRDNDVSGGYYRYMIADGIISLVIALLFALQIINYEVRNGSFYCLVSTICKFAAFIIIITRVFPESNSRTQEIWDMRRGVGAIIIISTFIWVMNMVMFVTTLYISRLNLLEDLNFDYSRKGLNSDYNRNELPAAPNPNPRSRSRSSIDGGGGAIRRSGSKRSKRHSLEEEENKEQLKEFYLNQNGEMYALNEEWEKEQHRGKNKILVYTF